jgi:hypothetical protein
MALAAIGQIALSEARNRKLVSGGLNALGKKTNNKVLKTLLGGGASVAKIFGLNQQAKYSQGGNVAGRRRRQRKSRGTQLPSGITVTAGNAPIDLARSKDIGPFFKITPSRAQNGCVVHCAVQVVPDPPSVTGPGFQNVAAFNLSPANPGLPWISDFADLFQKYKVKELVLHYQHYESTVQPGEVLMKYSPDADDNMVSENESEVANGSNFIRGAVYEDFSLKADLSGMIKNPLDTDYLDNDEDEAFAGTIGYFINHYVPSGGWTDPPVPMNPPGNFYIEMVVEFFDRKMASDDAFSPNRVRKVARSELLTYEEKAKYFAKYVDHQMEAAKARKERHNHKKQLVTLVRKTIEPAASLPVLPSAALKRK